MNEAINKNEMKVAIASFAAAIVMFINRLSVSPMRRMAVIARRNSRMILNGS